MDELISRNFREFFKQEDRNPAALAARIGYVVENPTVIDGLIARTLVPVPASECRSFEPARVEVVSDWQKFFGHLLIWDLNFNETNFPLGVDPGDEAEEFNLFDRTVIVREALEQFQRLEREEASLWAQGRYIKAHPEAQKKCSLLGTGARWQDGSDVCFPIFGHGGGPHVGLYSLDGKVDLPYRFLLRKRKATVRRSFVDMLAACQQKWVNPDFTEARWPLEPITPDEDEWEVAEHFFTDDADGNEKLCRLADLEKKGEIRICGVRRAMEFMAANLDLQKDHPLVVPVSVQHSRGYICLPAFSWHWSIRVEGRGLRLYDVRLRFNTHCGWLVLRKRRKA